MVRKVWMVQKLICRTVREELKASISQVKALGRDVAFPQRSETLIMEDPVERAEGAFISWSGDTTMAGRIG